MEIISKFRTLFIIKVFLGYILAIAIICFCLNFYRNIYNSERAVIATIVIAFTVAMIIGGSIDFLKVTKIVVKSTEFEIYSYFSQKREVKFSEITKIEKRRVVQYGKAGPITNGYTLSILILSNGKTIEISPDKFENYDEIIGLITSNMN